MTGAEQAPLLPAKLRLGVYEQYGRSLVYFLGAVALCCFACSVALRAAASPAAAPARTDHVTALVLSVNPARLLHFQRAWAQDAELRVVQGPSRADLPEARALFSTFARYVEPELVGTELVALGHYRMLQTVAAAAPGSWFAVLEDSARVEGDLRALVAALPPDAQLVHLNPGAVSIRSGSSGRACRRPAEVPTEVERFMCGSYATLDACDCYGVGGYLVTPEGAARVLGIFPVNKAIDVDGFWSAGCGFVQTHLLGGCFAPGTYVLNSAHGDPWLPAPRGGQVRLTMADEPSDRVPMDEAGA